MWIHWPFFPKTWTKGHWPLDDLWPHVCWGHMCDSTQGSLCPSPMTIHQCMWIQWLILQITTYIHTHTTYILHTTYYVQNEWSHSLLLNSVQARQKPNHQSWLNPQPHQDPSPTTILQIDPSITCFKRVLGAPNGKSNTRNSTLNSTLNTDSLQPWLQVLAIGTHSLQMREVTALICRYWQNWKISL